MSATNESKELGCDSLVRPWVGKLRHSRELIDDWGWLRDEAGTCIIMVRIPPDQNNADSLSDHRRNGTDPTQERVDAILALLNGPNAALCGEPKPSQCQ